MRVLYLHGFASGPRSTKGVAFEAFFAERGVQIDRLDLRVPSLEHLRLSQMIDVVRAALAGRAVVIGSSLGGLTAARVAELDLRVERLVLLAPAFRLVERWREQLGPAWADWQRTGWREITDYTTGDAARVDWGFIEDLERIDVGFPDIQVPTLIFHGTRDDVVPIAHSRAFAATRPNVRLVELDDTHELVASLPVMLAETWKFVSQNTTRHD